MAQRSLNKENRKLTWQLWLFAAGFLGFGFALVPLYNVLCDVTGYGDRSKLEKAATVVEAPDQTRTITIEFISSSPTYGSWEFRPEVAQLQVHPGKLYEAKFYAQNLRDQPVIAQAVPSIAPLQATQYFRKTECFCFQPQHFAGRQARELSVRFIVDPKLPATIDRLTLGYAMYDSKNTSG
ncbi:MAG TPA: cytochrome c oxidase assembly protein [Steroidobacteraceae bacterium]|jgi:cytochrome c oxidase assembly protein subunit 11|nr:cytochrome c oxidase assembly protein [Steroidobacteraceae bacterium]